MEDAVASEGFGHAGARRKASTRRPPQPQQQQPQMQPGEQQHLQHHREAIQYTCQNSEEMFSIIGTRQRQQTPRTQSL